jgi:hypothetical protein
MSATKKGMNRQDDGRFLAHFDTICKCGRSMGIHSAHRPFEFDDLEMEELPETHPNYGNRCAGFKKAKPQSTT